MEPRFILQKEDTTFYHLFRLVKGFVSLALLERIRRFSQRLMSGFIVPQVVKGTETPELTEKPEGGNTNPAFCDFEVQTSKRNSTSSYF